MSTLLKIKNPGDKRAHTCDARCYNAKGEVCHCFCKGKYHGKGLQYALEQIIKDIPTIKAAGITLGKAIEDAINSLKGMFNGQSNQAGN